VREYPLADLRRVGLERLASLPREAGHDPVIRRGGMGAKSRAAALARLQPQPGGPPLLAVATSPYAGQGFDCPALDTLFLAAPVASKGSLTPYAGRILGPGHLGSLQLSDLQPGGVNKLFVDVRAAGQLSGRSLYLARVRWLTSSLTRPPKLGQETRRSWRPGTDQGSTRGQSWALGAMVMPDP
jgi:hypothetical protein